MLSLIKRFSSHLFVPLGWTIITIILLSIPGSTIPRVNIYSIPHIDKLVHFFLFGGLAISWIYYRYEREPVIKLGRIVLFFILASILLGVIMEYIQFYFVPNRNFDIIDIWADSLGAVFFGLLVLLAETANNNKKPF